MATIDPATGARRPLKSRDAAWAAHLARIVAQIGLRPNHISLLSVVFGALAGASLLSTSRPFGAGVKAALFVAAAALMQLRLICNLIDGMVAVEGGFRTKAGEIWNELPDRFADAFIFIGAGYAQSSFGLQNELGWAAAVLAVIAAYVRALGTATGAGNHFCGPMAKQHRMAALTVACLLAPIEALLHWPPRVIAVTLAIIVLGCLVTIWRRVTRIVAVLSSR